MRCRPWTPDEDARVRQLREEGLTVDGIAVQLGRSYNSVKSYMQVHDLTEPVWWSHLQAQEALALYMRGVKLKAIGQHVGRSPEAVRALVRRQGALPRVRWVAMTDADRARIVELFTQGATITRIAKTVLRDRNSVRKVLRDRGLLASL